MNHKSQIGGIMMEYAVIMTFLSIVVTLSFLGGSIDSYDQEPTDSDTPPSVVYGINERQQDFTDSIYQP